METKPIQPSAQLWIYRCCNYTGAIDVLQQWCRGHEMAWFVVTWRDFPPFDTYRRGCDNEYGVANDVYAMERCWTSLNSAKIHNRLWKAGCCRRYQWFQSKAREELIGGTTRLFPPVMFRQSSVSPIEPQSTPIWRYQEFKINDGDPQWRLMMFERRSGQLFDQSSWLWWFDGKSYFSSESALWKWRWMTTLDDQKPRLHTIPTPR